MVLIGERWSDVVSGSVVRLSVPKRFKVLGKDDEQLFWGGEYIIFGFYGGLVKLKGRNLPTEGEFIVAKDLRLFHKTHKTVFQ